MPRLKSDKDKSVKDEHNPPARRNSIHGFLGLFHRSEGKDDKAKMSKSTPASREPSPTPPQEPEDERTPRATEPSTAHPGVAPKKIRSRSPTSVGSTPAKLQESYEAAVARSSKDKHGTSKHAKRSSSDSHKHDNYLTADELKGLFSGAPHFLLEKGKRSTSYPLVIFPWDSRSSIERLQDRKLLIHPSFTLCTLHAHLPVRWTQNGVVVPQDDPRDRQGSKRASYDVGIFEVPNMLSLMGKEPGCMGFAYFMELPISDMLLWRPPIRTGRGATDVEGMLESLRPAKEPYHAVCHPAVTLDRTKLIRDGPHAWKQLGVRNVSMKKLTLRLKKLAEMRYKILEQDKPISLLDLENVSELHHILYSTLLFPPPLMLVSHTPNIKSQINILTRVLCVRGAWVDFTMVEWRLRLGQLLWEFAPHNEGNASLDHANNVPTAGGGKDVEYATERKWLLIQLVLSLELLLRLDTAVRVGVIQRSKELEVTPQDTYALNNIRTEKSYWDVLFCRRLVESMEIKYEPTKETDLPVREPPPTKSRFSRFKFHSSADDPPPTPDEPAWSCVLIPQNSRRQLSGLFSFAEKIHWPHFDEFKARLSGKIKRVWGNDPLLATLFASPIRATPLPPGVAPLDQTDIFSKSWTTQLIRLHHPPTSVIVDDPNYIGGWLSRSWLTGCVFPGESINHLLMCTILENDPHANRRLGPVANLYGGFVFEGKSWWSRMCILGRVLACIDSASECMGWVYAPVVPQTASGEVHRDKWFIIDAMDVLKSGGKVPRIYDAAAVLHESSPLGAEGKLTANAFSLPLDDNARNPELKEGNKFWTALERVIVEPLEQGPQGPGSQAQQQNRHNGRPLKAKASLKFTIARSTGEKGSITFALSHGVCFISSFPCLPANGYLVKKSKDDNLPPSSTQTTPHNEPASMSLTVPISHHRSQSHPATPTRPFSKRLPGHPLHTASYPFEYIPVEDLPSITTFPPPPPPPFLQNRRPRRQRHPDLLSSTSSLQMDPSNESAIADDDEEITAPTSAATNPKHRQSHSTRHNRSYSGKSSTAATPRGSTTTHNPPPPPKTTYIVDARGSDEKELFVRAWCASIGASAVVGRSCRTCLACCIREARACDVDLVIRTDGPEEPFSVSNPVF